jgi:hypothetical protein
VSAARLALVACLLVVAGCKKDAPTTELEQAATAAPAPDAASLYPASRPALLDARGTAYLPDSTFAVVAAASPAALIAAGELSRAIERGGHPYDSTIAAVTLWALGIELESAADVADAGLDAGAVWAVAFARPDGLERIVFGPVPDAAKLRERLAGKKKRPLGEQKVGEAVVLTGRKGDERAVVLRDGLAFFVHADVAGLRAQAAIARRRAGTDAEPRREKNEKPAEALALRIAGTKQGEGLAASDGYAQSLEALAFGAHASAFVQARVLLADRAVRIREEKADAHRHDDDDASLDERIAALEKLSTRVTGLAIGAELGPTAVRLKAHAALAEGPSLARPIAMPTLPSLPRGAVAGDFDPGLRDELLDLFDDAGARRALASVGLELGGDLRAHLRGEIYVHAVPAPLGKQTHGLEMALRVRDTKAVRELIERAQRRSPVENQPKDAIVIESDERTHRISLVGDWLRIEAGGAKSTAVAETPWPASDSEPAVAALAGLGDGALFAFDARWLDDRLDPPSRRSPFAPDTRSSFLDAREFGMIGLLNSGGALDAKRRERLEKKRDKLREEIASLKQRQELAEKTGGERLVTALGTTVVVARSVPGGVAFYGVQRLGEENATALVEQALFALVDASPVSETARELAKLQRELEEVEEKLSGERSAAFSAELEGLELGMLEALQSSRATEGVLGSSDVPMGLLGDPSGSAAGAGGLGLSGVGRGGGGSGEGIGLGNIGTIGHGAGTGQGFGRGGGSVRAGTARGPKGAAPEPPKD